MAEISLNAVLRQTEYYASPTAVITPWLLAGLFSGIVYCRIADESLHNLSKAGGNYYYR